MQAFQSPHLVRSHRMYLIPPATNCDTLCEVLSTQDAHLRLGIEGFLGGQS